MLTYADVQRIYRTEKNSTTLQKIQDNFYAEVKILLLNIGEEHHSYLEKLIQEIQEKRKNKLLIQAMRGTANPANLTPAEKELYNPIMTLIDDYQDKLSLLYQRTPEKEPIRDKPALEEATKPEKAEEPPDKIKIKILRDLPAMIGPKLESHGPFSENQEVVLPEKMAKILLEKEVAERI